MKIAEMTRFAREREFYFQGLEGYPLYISLPLTAGGGFLKQMHSVGYGFLIIFFKENMDELFFERGNILKMAEVILQKKVKDQNFFRKIDAKWDKRLRQFFQEGDKILHTNLAKLNEEKLTKLYTSFTEQFIDVWRDFEFIDSFDANWERMIEQYLQKHKSSLTKEEIEILTSPFKRSFIQQEELELCQLAIKRRGEIMRGSPIIPELSQHQQKWYWYQDNYGNVRFLDYNHFLQRAQDALKGDVAAKIGELENVEKEMAKRQQEVKKKRKLPSELARVLELFAELAFYRDKRKSFMLRGNAAVHLLVREYSRRRGIPEELLVEATVREIPLFMKGDKEKIRKRLQRRLNEGFAFILPNDNAKDIIILEEHTAQLHALFLQKLGMHKDVTEIKGSVACAGKAIGKVKVIDLVKDFGKMQPGDILVSKMTRPEFITIMKKAAAIVTDEGGITCHAAIVSRELKIPCIIGTQKATRVFKDGDVVEVDAKKGIVRKIK